MPLDKGTGEELPFFMSLVDEVVRGVLRTGTFVPAQAGTQGPASETPRFPLSRAFVGTTNKGPKYPQLN